MTEAEKIICKMYLDDMDKNHTCNEYKLLMQLLEQEPCNDCLSRQAVLDKISEVCFSRDQEWIDFRVSQGSNGQRDLIINFIESLPSIQPEPSRSEDSNKWISADVIERIKAEITEIVVEEIRVEEKWARGLYYAIKVIDKYISQTGAESEG